MRLRAERSAKGNGRIYTVTIIGTDVSGNKAQEKVEIRVPHDLGKSCSPGETGEDALAFGRGQETYRRKSSVST